MDALVGITKNGKFEIDLWQLSNLLASVMTLTTTAWQKKNDGSFSNSTEGRSNSEVNCIFGASIAIIAAQLLVVMVTSRKKGTHRGHLCLHDLSNYLFSLANFSMILAIFFYFPYLMSAFNSDLRNSTSNANDTSNGTTTAPVENHQTYNFNISNSSGINTNIN